MKQLNSINTVDKSINWLYSVLVLNEVQINLNIKAKHANTVLHTMFKNTLIYGFLFTFS